MPVPLVTTGFTEVNPAVSPDGRWLAYASNESGGFEVYVRPFPNTNDGKWQVSTEAGSAPVWAHSGRELFYANFENLIVVEVLPGATFVYGEPRALFSRQGFSMVLGGRAYDLTRDDQRFVMIRNRVSEEVEAAGELIVVENFFEELKAKVGH